MGDKCANCGRADLLQADVRNYQCLACGALTDIETKTPVPVEVHSPLLSNAGYRVKELSRNVTVGESHEFVTKVAGPDPVEEVAPVQETVPEPVVEPVTEPVVDPTASLAEEIASLSPEQLEAIAHIVHPEVENGETDSSAA